MLFMVRTSLSPLRVGMRQVLDDRRRGRLYSSCSSELRMAASQFMRCGSTGEIEDVLEFQIAKAIIAGDIQVISHEPHLFELCLDFNHDDTAMALLTHGVPGCRLEAWHLGPYARGSGRCMVCDCGSAWTTCESCCWGSDIRIGEWMRDWSASLSNAIKCADTAVRRPVARAVLDALRSGEEFGNLHISEAAMLRLLDLAILTGDADLAQRCAQRCGARKPLRRWRSDEIFHDCDAYWTGWSSTALMEPDVMAAALLSGIALQSFSVDNDIPLREAIVLFGDSQLWNRLAHLLPEGRSQWIPKGPDSGRLLCKFEGNGMRQPQLCLDRLNLACAANMALAEFCFLDPFLCDGCRWTRRSLQPLRLLDVAVHQGQSACAELLASAGAPCATGWTHKACLPNVGPWPCACAECENAARINDSSIVPLEERRAAAGAALRVALARAERLVAPTGPGVYQLLLLWGRGKKVPAALVNLVLSFAAEKPQLASILEGLEEEVLQAASAAQREVDGPVDRLVAPLQQNQQPQGEVSTPAEAPAGEADPADSAEEMMEGQDAKTDDLLVAIRNSRADPPPLSPDGVICFKLTRKSNAPHVNELLFDAEGPLKELHDRVRDAECEVAPDWSPFKALFVPLTQMQLLELTAEGLSADQKWGP